MKAVDVLVVGGGPAGSSVANIVASQHHDVLVLEQATFPRYHIGESLIPFTFHALERLGVVDELRKSSFVKKYSVQFAQEDGTLHRPFYFSSRYDINSVAQTWQVDRAKFDHMLMHQATARGAQVQYGAHVDEVLYDTNGRASGARYTNINTRTTHEVGAKWVVDASGRSALVAKKHQWTTRDPVLRNKMAVWTYFQGCPRAKGMDGGATVVAFIKNKGWFWFIPLENNITSVGVVAESSHLMRDGIRGLDNVFWREAHNNKWLQHVLSTATVAAEFKSTTDYSMQSQHAAAPGVVLVGDALAFLDPVFSSGVLLALKSGVMVGDVLCETLVDNNLDASVFDAYHQRMHISVENMRKLIHAFYDINISFKDIMQQHPWAADRITDCLSGDLEQDYSDLWNILK